MSRVPSITAWPGTGLVVASLLFGCGSSDAEPTTPVRTPVSVGITDPSEGAMIPLASLVDGSDYELSYEVDNFTVAPPGECAGKDTPCGHARVWVDDMACNDQTRSLSYNAEGASPVEVGFDYCPMPFTGGHDILLKLYGDDDQPFIDPAGNREVTATVHVTITSSGSGGAGGSGGSGGQAGAR